MFNDEELIFIRTVMLKYDWWKNKKIVEKIDDYFNEKEKEQKCEHETGEFVGKKMCCKKCGHGTEDGFFESWSLVGGGFD